MSVYAVFLTPVKVTIEVKLLQKLTISRLTPPGKMKKKIKTPLFSSARKDKQPICQTTIRSDIATRYQLYVKCIVGILLQYRHT